MSDEIGSTVSGDQEAANPEAAPQPVPASDSSAAEGYPPTGGYEEVSDFVGEFEDESVPDPSTVITIRTSGGDTRYVPVPEGRTLTAGEVFMNSGLSVSGNGGFQIYLNGAIIKVTDIVPVGSTLTVVGSVKGGSR